MPQPTCRASFFVASLPGWTLGGGEYAITSTSPPSSNTAITTSAPDKIGLTPQKPGLRRAFVGIDDTDNVVRAGINLRFGP